MAMAEIKQRLLLFELARIGFHGAAYNPVSDRVDLQPANSRLLYINDANDIGYGIEHDRLANSVLRPIVSRVAEIISAWEHSTANPFENLSQYRILAAYNNIVFAARDDTALGRGFHFITWQYNYDRSGLDNGHYTEDYDAAKEDFAKRSGLVFETKLLTPELAAEITKSIEFRFNNDSELTDAVWDTLRSIIERFRAAYPETMQEQQISPENTKQTLSEKMHAANKKVKTQDSADKTKPGNRAERE